jgi:hypothetical protein
VVRLDGDGSVGCSCRLAEDGCVAVSARLATESAGRGSGSAICSFATSAHSVDQGNVVYRLMTSAASGACVTIGKPVDPVELVIAVARLTGRGSG